MSDTKKTTSEIVTDVGCAGMGENFFKGHALIGELAGRETTWSLASMAVDGPPLDEQTSALFDYFAAATMVPEPRIWLFKACRLVACYGSPLMAQGAAKLILQGSFLGPHAAGNTARALVKAKRELGDASDDPEAVESFLRGFLREHRTFPGFGVVGRQVDERQFNIDKWYVKNFQADGDYWQMSRRLIDAAEAINGLRPNVALSLGSILLDLGYDAGQIELLSMKLTDIILTAMSCEGAKQVSKGLQRLDDSDVVYTGPKHRQSPRARAMQGARETS